MAGEIGGFAVRSKVWIEDGQGRAVFGGGRCRILETVGRLNSLQAAAKELKMSYRAVWGRIRASEERLGQRLVESDGRGSRLTPFAQELVAAYRGIEATIRAETDAAFTARWTKALDSESGPADKP